MRWWLFCLLLCSCTTIPEFTDFSLSAPSCPDLPETLTLKSVGMNGEWMLTEQTIGDFSYVGAWDQPFCSPGRFPGENVRYWYCRSVGLENRSLLPDGTIPPPQSFQVSLTLEQMPDSVRSVEKWCRETMAGRRCDTDVFADFKILNVTC